MSDEETIRVYDAKAADYAAFSDDHNAADPLLAAFIAACPPGGRVLDLGCGPGASAAVMARAGLEVDAWDASAQMVALAARHDGVTARRATFDDLSAKDFYDGVWANFSLLHAPRADLPGHLAAIARALKPAGVLHLGMKTGTGAARDRLGRHYTYVTEAELAAFLNEAGFAIDAVAHGQGKGLAGDVEPWVAMRAHA